MRYCRLLRVIATFDETRSKENRMHLAQRPTNENDDRGGGYALSAGREVGTSKTHESVLQVWRHSSV
ncbi:MAG: hypothetical protein J07HR59_01044 [Halorubrum sp. J07HR59]|nr:MAG: hypothetical protein J07HR59_01044 [Halorubrum sp. J07HR59]